MTLLADDHLTRAGRAARSFGMSLRWRILGHLAFLGVVMTAAFLTVTAMRLSQHNEQQLIDRAAGLASSLVYAAEAAEGSEPLTRFITALGSEPDVLRAAIIEPEKGSIAFGAPANLTGRAAESVLSQKEWQQAAALIAAGNPGSTLLRSDDTALYLAYRPLLHEGEAGTLTAALIAVELSESTFLAGFSNAGWSFMLLLGAGLLAFMAALGFLIYDLVLKPLKGLQQLVLRNAEGDESLDGVLARSNEFSGLARSMSEAFERAEATSRRLTQMAMTDSLTGLGNRAAFIDALHQEIARASMAGDTRLALMLVDLDNFKAVNDLFGHDAGDILLRQVAAVLREHARPGDVLARLGADEFAFILSDAASLEDVQSRARKILDALNRPLQIEGSVVRGGAGAGLTLFPQDGREAEVLLKNADLALQMAKSEGHNNLQFFRHELKLRALERNAIERDLMRAIENHELELHFQPKIDLRGRMLAGSEALLRWRHPERGYVPPWAFIPVAEESGFIAQLTQWVIDEACRHVRHWQDEGAAPVPVAVNVSAIDLLNGDLSDFIAGTLAKHGVSPKYLEIEVTESMVMHDVETVIGTLRRLRSMGIGISIDDFGTGYSSLAYLKRFPVKCLKIDRSFVDDIEKSGDGAAIPKLIIDLGRSLGVKVVAEGVETLSQAERLIDLGCDEAQGFYFARPMPADAFGDYLANGKGQGEIETRLPQTGAADHVRRALKENTGAA